MRKFVVAALLASLLVACGGGGGSSEALSVPPPIAGQKLVGEVIAVPSEIASTELRTTAGYAGNVTASNALQAAGKENLLDLLFMLDGARNKVAADAESRLAQYATDNANLLTPGVRVLIADEVFWNPADSSDTDAVLQPQLDALRDAVTMVRRYIPQARIGITVSPYAMTGRPNALEYAKRAIASVDWVGTDPYWLGDPANVQSLDDWSSTFNTLAKRANPAVETWFIAQAFKDPAWDEATFNRFIAAQLSYAEQYDNILFFGWQFTSELAGSAAGKNFPLETRRLYSKYLKTPVQ